MIREKSEFCKGLILDDGVRKRHRHETTGGKVIHFVVQLEIRIEQEWKVAIRYDCAHGYSHVDRCHSTFNLKVL
ncbi:MAG: hypothetical protein ABIC39_03950 [Pseudomonadota bacterium]